MLNSLINVMQNMWRDGDCGATELINNIAAHIIEQHWNTPAVNARQNTVFDYRIKFALEHLNTVEEPHHLNRLAREVGLSRSHFFKLFRECTGFSPLMFVNAHRMETAIAGITRSDASLIDLAFDLGFSTHGNFTRFFRQQIGVTPSNFQRAAVGV
jgi:AraC-like DNA-binding protein